MKSGAVILGVVVSVLLLAAGGALYVLSGNYGDSRHYRAALTLVREIRQLSSEWSIEAARVRSDPLADFDSLTAFVPRITRLKESLSDTTRRIPDSARPAGQRHRLLPWRPRRQGRAHRALQDRLRGGAQLHPLPAARGGERDAACTGSE